MGVGSYEQHGPWLPIGTDSKLADVLVKDVARRLGSTLVAPTFGFGISHKHIGFPGTITIEPYLLSDALIAITGSILKTGFRHLWLAPTHGGNFDTVDTVVRNDTSGRLHSLWSKQIFINTLYHVSDLLGINEEVAGRHAGEIETSIYMFLKEAGKLQVREPLHAAQSDLELAQRALSTSAEERWTTCGVIGDPNFACSSHGELYWNALVELAVESIRSYEA